MISRGLNESKILYLKALHLSTTSVQFRVEQAFSNSLAWAEERRRDLSPMLKKVAYFEEATPKNLKKVACIEKLLVCR